MFPVNGWYELFIIMTSTRQPPASGTETATLREPPYWQAFILAQNADERGTAWLALICQRIAGVQAAAVLIEHTPDHSYVPIAVWPKASPDLGRLGAAVAASIKERRGVVKPAPEPSRALHVAYPLLIDEQIAGLVALEVNCPENQVAEIFREIHWGGAWLVNLLSGRELTEANQARQRLGSVLEATAILLRHGQLQQALFDTCNVLRQQLTGSRVAIGLVANSHVRLSTLSEAASFEKHAALTKAYQAAMEESFDHGRLILLPNSQAPDHPQHLALCRYTGAGAVLSMPMLQGARCVAVLTVERAASVFSDEDVLWLEAFAGLAAPIITQRREAERGVLGRARRDLEKLFGQSHLSWKFASLCLLVLNVLLVLVPFDYRVSAKTVIEGEVQRVVAAPFEGFISEAWVRAGHSVKEGQVLAQLDDRELRMEEAKWTGERDQYQQRLREARATRDLPTVQISSAQLQQSQAELALVLDKIRRARLVAPFDGIVVSGDLSQQIGAPVETGKQLFKVAPLHSYRIILQVDERDIRHIQVGQAGQLVMTGIAGEPMAFQVANVTPVATAEEGKNFFRVEASLAEASQRLRPGMEGIGKIEVGERCLWWITTHGFSDWLTLSVWSWMP